MTWFCRSAIAAETVVVSVMLPVLVAELVLGCVVVLVSCVGVLLVVVLAEDEFIVVKV